MNKKKFFLLCVIFIIASYFIGNYFFKNFNFNFKYTVGDKIDSLNGVYVYYNGGVNHVDERNLTSDGYNIGLKYQCVEFVKRYYYQKYNHKMPNASGHAKEFFNRTLNDGSYNKDRDLIQFSNPSNHKPEVGEIIIFDSNTFNKYGHVAIISNVTDTEIEIIQQNAGPYSHTRKIQTRFRK